jgi:hypothetical protein
MLLNVWVFWDVMLHSWVSSSWYFEGLSCLLLHSQAVHDCSWTAQPWRWRCYDPSKCRKLFTKWHSITLKSSILKLQCLPWITEEILTKITVFWHMTPCSLEDKSQHVEQPCCLHHMPQRWKQQVLLKCYCSVYVSNHVSPTILSFWWNLDINTISSML